MPHLTLQEREVIARMRYKGYSQVAMAKELGRSPSTICRELGRNRNTSHSYVSSIAQNKSVQRRAERPIVRTLEEPELLKRVSLKLEQNWSPEQICGRLAIESGKSVISHQTIYNYLGSLKFNHPHRQAMRRKGRGYLKKKSANCRETIPNRVSIHQRPKCVDDRKRFGDWELDLVVGSKHSGFLITAVDRRSGYLKTKKINSKRSRVVMRGIIAMFRGEDSRMLKTFTFDNGREFTRHEMLKEQLGVKVYFADPYNSGQRGTNENTNGLIRQYAPKKLDFGYVSHRDVRHLTARINNRPRKRLQYRTPLEVLYNSRKIASQI